MYVMCLFLITFLYFWQHNERWKLLNFHEVPLLHFLIFYSQSWCLWQDWVDVGIFLDLAMSLELAFMWLKIFPFILWQKLFSRSHAFFFSFLFFPFCFDSCYLEFVYSPPVYYIWKPFFCILIISLNMTSVRSILSPEFFTINIVVLASKQWCPAGPSATLTSYVLQISLKIISSSNGGEINHTRCHYMLSVTQVKNMIL